MDLGVLAVGLEGGLGDGGAGSLGIGIGVADGHNQAAHGAGGVELADLGVADGAKVRAHVALFIPAVHAGQEIMPLLAVGIVLDGAVFLIEALIHVVARAQGGEGLVLAGQEGGNAGLGILDLLQVFLQLVKGGDLGGIDAEFLAPVGAHHQAVRQGVVLVLVVVEAQHLAVLVVELAAHVIVYVDQLVVVGGVLLQIGGQVVDQLVVIGSHRAAIVELFQVHNDIGQLAAGQHHAEALARRAIGGVHHFKLDARHLGEALVHRVLHIIGEHLGRARVHLHPHLQLYGLVGLDGIGYIGQRRPGGQQQAQRHQQCNQLFHVGFLLKFFSRTLTELHDVICTKWMV